MPAAESTPAAAVPAPAGGEAPIVVADDVHRTFHIGANRIDVLKGVSFEIQAGERVFLCGASGAGKTSLLYTLAGLEKPNLGRVLIDGRSLYQLSRREQAKVRNRRMGYVFQNYSLLPELTALENVMVPAMIGGRSDRGRAEHLLEHVGLADRIGHLPPELSGGEQQRVAIARALMNDPAMIFADEPTGNLDSKTGAEVMDILLNVVAEEKRTLLVVTHDTVLAKSGDRRLELVDGLLVS
ncbi:MAG: ABC transporter ATP-binding protein [Verrucomicrobiae bacterium]|nr:ABC transporter ATP-binding protein [Verrucomicrobiae bacterium]